MLLLKAKDEFIEMVWIISLKQKFHRQLLSLS